MCSHYSRQWRTNESRLTRGGHNGGERAATADGVDDIEVWRDVACREKGKEEKEREGKKKGGRGERYTASCR